MKRSSGQESEEAPLPKRLRTVQDLYDISPIIHQRGGVEYYKERFFRWRQINGRDDPDQPYAAKLDSWRTFVRLENEHRMEDLLHRAPKHSQEWTPSSVASDGNSTGCSRTRERRQERQPPVFGEVPTYRRSVDTQATGLDRSAEASLHVESSDPHDRRSTQQSTGALPEGQSAEAAEFAEAIEHLWKWKDYFLAHVERLEQRCATLEEDRERLANRCDSYQARCGQLERKIVEQTGLVDALAKDFDALATQQDKLEKRQSVLEKDFADHRDQASDLQKLQQKCAQQHDRLLGSMDEAGRVLETLRGQLESRLSPLEEIKTQAFDVLQRLYAEKELQGNELGTLREQVDQLQKKYDHFRKNY